MNNRKINMLETALTLFAKKGYHATSIQEITEAWGISKGAFYHHFSSKEELMLCIMKYYSDLAFKQVQMVTEGESEKEIFIEQIRIQFSIIDSYKVYIRMQFTEKHQQMTEKLQQYIFEARVKVFKWYVKRLIEVYGEQIRPYVIDCVVLLLSMMHGYMSLIIVDQKPLLFERTARFLVNRLDSIINQFGEEEPLLTKEIMKEYLHEEEKVELLHVQNRLAALRNALPATDNNVTSSLDALETEFASSAPREYMAEGLLLYLEKQGIEDWKDELPAFGKVMKRFFQTQNIE